ncbi:hypothetical protein C5748_03840 [Phyllobacterium phragmitis]|uniref:DUF1799 domain-containing protein n=1 Tax=Phyllobacterium phragmitis TaxID=2670329 RepID=A0A2S9IY18_9HYPH|nr:hypothetical protein C5748_03840 [Phyllobacterium phragmitis]
MEGSEDAEPEDHVEVWSECWNAFLIWLDCETQWRVAAGMSGFHWLGLDYTAVDVVLRRRNADNAIFDDLRLMEAAALETFGEVVE